MGWICRCNTIPLTLEVNTDHPDHPSIKMKSIFQSSKLTWGSFQVPFTILISSETHSSASKQHTTLAGGCRPLWKSFLRNMCRRSEKETKGTYKSYGMPECCPGECKKFMLFAVCISLPELNFIPSMESKHLFSFFWQGTQSHGKAIQFSGLLPVLFPPKRPSISHQDHHYNVCQNMFKIWSCKNRN